VAEKFRKAMPEVAAALAVCPLRELAWKIKEKMMSRVRLSNHE
jgi:hypothetical protein